MSHEPVELTARAELTAEDPARRRFVTRLSVALGAAVGAAAVVPSLGVVLHPLLRARPEGAAPGVDAAWTTVGSARRFEAGGAPVRVVLKEDRTDAWLARPDTPVGPVLVRRLDEERFQVFSGICPHLGCSVGFGDGERPFLCPCHRSAFDRDGERVAHVDGHSNPAPRGLDALEWRVADDILQVRWVRYQTGRAERVPVA